MIAPTLPSTKRLIIAVIMTGALLTSCDQDGSHPISTVTPTAAPPVAEATTAIPAPKETPNFAEPFWYQEWLERELAMPRTDQVVNGIAVGPSVERTGSPCSEVDQPKAIDHAETLGSRVEITFGYLPDEARVQYQEAVECAGEPILISAIITFASLNEAELRRRLDAGESFFDLPHGGSIEILRFVGDPAIESGVAAARWEARTIAGFRAAIARPIFDEGFGQSAVVVYDEGVLTVVRGQDVALDVVIQVAEGLFE